MTGAAPPFWWDEPGLAARALLPISFAYAAVAAWRMDHAPRMKLDAPVLCVGNFTVGGAGKTPTAIALAGEAKRIGLRPGFLSRGHGGSAREPILVDRERHAAAEIGDEPLLLAEHAPVAVTPRREEGGRLLIAQGCDFLIMDDGFQSARIAIDFALLVVDGRRGIGNGQVIPAGPLRAPLAAQMARADALLVIGDGEAGAAVLRMGQAAGKPVLSAELRPKNPGSVAGRRVLAFAGIGDPEKFFATLRDAGAEIIAARGFPDHRAYTDAEIAGLAREADSAGLMLVTTAKDMARLETGTPAARALAAKAAVLDVELMFEDAGAPGRIIGAALDAFASRRRMDGNPA